MGSEPAGQAEHQLADLEHRRDFDRELKWQESAARRE
jgi:hypothetical protein